MGDTWGTNFQVDILGKSRNSQRAAVEFEFAVGMQQGGSSSCACGDVEEVSKCILLHSDSSRRGNAS